MPTKPVKQMSQNVTPKALKKSAASQKQSAFLKGLVKCRFNVSRAAKLAGIDRRTAYRWRESNKSFREQWDDLNEELLDSMEECLYKNILNADTTSIIFALKTKGKERGYVERENSSKKVGKLLEQVLADEITTREAAYRINAMGMPLPEVLKLELQRDSFGTDSDSSPINVEEIERRAQESYNEAIRQREVFLPQRREEVAEMKEMLKKHDNFASENFH